VPATFPTVNTWQLFTQWHHSGSNGSPPLELLIYGNSLQMKVGGSSGTMPWTVPLVRGVWHDFILHVKWSSNPSVGFLELWFDGSLSLPKKYVATMFAGYTNSLKMGLYRDSNVSQDGVLYLDGMTRATTLADVMPPPPPPDAGTPVADAGTAVADAGSSSPAPDAGSPPPSSPPVTSVQGPLPELEPPTPEQPPIEEQRVERVSGETGDPAPGTASIPGGNATVPPEEEQRPQQLPGATGRLACSAAGGGEMIAGLAALLAIRRRRRTALPRCWPARPDTARDSPSAGRARTAPR
jgi:hypothetical protein